MSDAASLNLTIVAPSALTAIVDLSPYYNVSGSAVDSVPFSSGGVWMRWAAPIQAHCWAGATI
jgi:hypothetical protein